MLIGINIKYINIKILKNKSKINRNLLFGVNIGICFKILNANNLDFSLSLIFFLKYCLKRKNI